MRTALEACGVVTEEFEDGLAIQGSAGAPLAGGGKVATLLDHRIAMSMTVAALAAEQPTAIDDVAPVATSYPNFFATLDALTHS